jgi:AAA15 family ATPase/GTPase
MKKAEIHERFIPHLLFGGYRSFGTPPQRFDRFARINLLIGPNNSGK